MSDLDGNLAGTVTVRYWAGARAAAGTDSEQYECVANLTLGALLSAVEQRHGAASRLAQVLATCSFLVDDLPVGRSHADEHPLTAGAVIEVLPPFAGG